MITLLLTTGCHLTMELTDQEPHPEFPGTVHVGEIPVVPLDEFRDSTLREEHTRYHISGPTGRSVLGGASATFTGTGGKVCLIADPESAYWSEAVSLQEPDTRYTWPDNSQDDGDVDLMAGLSAYYTGTPGYDLGDFKAIYEDSLGVEVEIEFNECTIADAYAEVGGHSGRGTSEYCTIDTSAHPAVEYTVVMTAYSMPLDDDLLTWSYILVDGSCEEIIEGDNDNGIPGIAMNECTRPGEARVHAEWTGDGQWGYDRDAAPQYDEDGGLVLFELDDFRTIESYLCLSDNEFGEGNPGPAAYCEENYPSRWCGEP